MRVVGEVLILAAVDGLGNHDRGCNQSAQRVIALYLLAAAVGVGTPIVSKLIDPNSPTVLAVVGDQEKALEGEEESWYGTGSGTAVVVAVVKA